MSRNNQALALSVGSSPAPNVCSASKSKTDKVLFFGSSASLAQSEIVGLTKKLGNRALTAMTTDHQELMACLRAVMAGIEKVEASAPNQKWEWDADITGGTKQMSVALALALRDRVKSFNYVAGTDRDTGGLGKVKDGAEFMLSSSNPWTTLGWFELEEAKTAFNGGDYALAYGRASAIAAKVNTPLAAQFAAFCGLYKAWDACDYAAAKAFAAAAGTPTGYLKLARQQVFDANQLLLNDLAKGAKLDVLKDLFFHAARCLEQGRPTDAAARFSALLDQASVELLKKHALPAAENTLHSKYHLFLKRKGVRLWTWDKEFDRAVSARNSSPIGHGVRPVPPAMAEVFLRASRQALARLDCDVGSTAWQFPQIKALKADLLG